MVWTRISRPIGTEERTTSLGLVTFRSHDDVLVADKATDDQYRGSHGVSDVGPLAKAVCFVVSDFFDDGYLQALQMANRKHDVIAVLVTDPVSSPCPTWVWSICSTLKPES